MELTDDDVLEILKLFEQSKFDFLQLQQGERKITVSKGGYVPQTAGATASVTPPAIVPAAASAATPASAAPQPAPKPRVKPADAGLVPVTAPMVGKFYAAASPAD